MSFSFIRNANRIKKPLTLLGALVAMSLSAAEAMGDDNPVWADVRVAKRPAARSPLNPSVAPQAFSGTHRLRNIGMSQFEQSVIKIWGERLRTSTSDDGRFVWVQLPNNLNASMAMVVDRQSATITYKGDENLKDNWHQIIDNIDSRPQPMRDGTVLETRLIDGSADHGKSVKQVGYLARPPQGQDGSVFDQLPVTNLPQGALNALPQEQEIPAGTQGIKNPVKIIRDPESGIVRLIGDPEDIAIIERAVLDINKQTKAVQPEVERIMLKNLQSEQIAELVQSLYDEGGYEVSSGPVRVSPLASPNALIVVGQKDAIAAVQKIVNSMDGGPAAVDTDGPSGFKAFRLKYISAADAALRLNTYFGQEAQGAGDNTLPSDPVTVIPDFRSNTVVVRGSETLIKQAMDFIETIDVIDGNAVNEVKVIPLRNTVAADMAIVIQDAINGQQQNAGQGANPNAQNQNLAQNTQTDINTSTLRSALLSLTDGTGREIIGAIMFDVRVTADSSSNSLVVTGPKESLPLIEALVYQLDRLPNAETLIKVFEIVNGDAQTLLDMLEALFGTDDTGQNQGGTSLNSLPLQAAAASDGQTLVSLRFSADLRTNTIIASGPAGDLQVVEDLLNRLDTQDDLGGAQVYRLSNAPALDVADAITTWLDGLNDLASNDPRINNGVSSSNRGIVVVPEVVSNSLLVTARPEYQAEVERIIRALDRRPPMVKVKCLIAEVDLTTLEEFGVEVGVQDSLLFDRGTLVDAATGAITGGIGFPFNTQTIPNLDSAGRESFAGQGLSNLGVGRINTDLGYGGLVLSAGNESVNVLLRALKDRQAVRVLSKPQLMTIENLQGRVSIGAEVPRIAGSTQNGVGNVTQDIEFVDVGVILEVTPRVSPDGMIVMAVNVQKSAVGPDATGITIGFDNGQPIISPQIIETEAQTTLMARSGQTVVFSGLIQEDKTHVERGAPILSDLPVIGPLFKFESDEAVRSELLIVMTPYLITDDGDIEASNYEEMDRIHWCEQDVAEIYGSTEYNGIQGGGAGAVETFYPDADPTGSSPINFQQNGQFAEPPQAGFGAVPQPTYQGVPQANARPVQRLRSGLRRPTQNASIQRASYSTQGRAR